MPRDWEAYGLEKEQRTTAGSLARTRRRAGTTLERMWDEPDELTQAPVLDMTKIGELSDQYSRDIFASSRADIESEAEEGMSAAVSSLAGRGMGRSSIRPGSGVVAKRTKAIGRAAREARVSGAELGMAGAKSMWESEFAGWEAMQAQKERKRKEKLAGLYGLVGGGMPTDESALP